MNEAIIAGVVGQLLRWFLVVGGGCALAMGITCGIVAYVAHQPCQCQRAKPCECAKEADWPAMRAQPVAAD